LATSSIFNSARQKIARAKKHAVEFDSLEKDYVRKECSGFVTETDPDNGSKVVKIRFLSPVPFDIAGVVSDAANNLRDALDHAGYATAEVFKRGSKPKHTGFPFAASAEQLEKSISIREARAIWVIEVVSVHGINQPLLETAVCVRVQQLDRFRDVVFAIMVAFPCNESGLHVFGAHRDLICGGLAMGGEG
jgi:hypothetical protein